MLGQGSYGKVMKNGNKAVKSFDKLSHLVQEYTAMRYLSACQYIVHEKGINIDKLELKMELFDGSLRKWITDHPVGTGWSGAINGGHHPTGAVGGHHPVGISVGRKEADLVMIVSSVLKGLIELHDRGLAHGDLKPGNILVSELTDKSLRVVLGDLGFVSIAKYSKMDRTAVTYRDPIVHYDTSHDMYSFGIIILELLTDVKLKHQTDYPALNLLIHKRVSNDFYKNIILRLVQSDHTKRPTARETLYYFTKETPLHPSFDFEPSAYASNGANGANGADKWQEHVKTLMWENMTRFKINRSKKGYIALINYLHYTNKKDYKLYACATLIILAANFGESSLRDKKVLELCHCDNKYSTSDLYTAVYNLMMNEKFLNTLFC